MTGLGQSTRGLDCPHIAELGRFALNCLQSTYSVEKHKIDGDLIFLPRALSTLDPHPACPSADARAPTDVSSVSQYPLVSRCLGRL